MRVREDNVNHVINDSIPTMDIEETNTILIEYISSYGQTI